MFEEHNIRSLARQLNQVTHHFLGHQTCRRNDERFIACAAAGDEATAFATGSKDEGIRDIVDIISALRHFVDDIDKFRCPFIHVTDFERNITTGLFLPDVVDGKINQKIIIRFAALKKRLATGDIVEECRSITPDAVRRRHVDGSVEQPSGPRCFARRIRCAMEKNMVDTGGERQVDVRFAL